jgi:N6-L-threonylcarbamoyladenine synthase
VTVRILGIETSCDETAASVVEEGVEVLSNVVASQSEMHAQYGGVYPELASRAHIETIHSVITSALSQAHVSLDDISAIAVTRGPGLAGSLLVGINAAKGLALARGLALLGINHLEGHIYSHWLGENAHEVKFPLLALVVSGGHTEIILVVEHMQYQRLGGTLDDAAGEAFDKVGRLLGLPYPGGPSIEKTALEGNPEAFDFPRAWMDKSWDFSFSGLKTAVMRAVKQRFPEWDTGRDTASVELPVADLAASCQAAIVEVLTEKSVQAAVKHECTAILVSGGVSANKALCAAISERSGDIEVYHPHLQLCTDNAAMIAAAGYRRYQAGQRDTWGFDARPNWPLLK